MDLDQQIQTLIDESPDSTAAQAVQVVAPLLKSIAEQLQHQEYYILQNIEQGWVMTTVRNRQSADEKTVVYAYPSLAAAAASGQNNPQMMAVPYPTTHLLFQLLSLKQLDSFIFLEAGGKKGAEIRRQDFEAALRQQLQQLTDLPPDIA
ncbi:MAG: hypothetical protein F6J97_12050 [Leptolyngbya sp. SIO4C1]|nr:hypothetical protein [Leptolyngbya sp. SIO4C1]